ncbi:DNA polymerase IV [Candidatus Micrarchaeota archaeon]|nr:DNA polymerase IV [Candidatus Micrarchaeota archaeon]
MFVHIDMDYFFAQVEERDRPEIKNKIVVVCVFSGRTEDSGVVSTVNYEGRKYGIKSGLPIVFAKKKAEGKDAIFLPMDRERYETASMQIDEVIRNKMDYVVQASIDEWNCFDEKALEKAQQIKKEIFERTDLKCTIGVAPSVLGAKMAAATVKPNGFLVLNENEEHELVEKSELRDVPGIGNKTAEALGQMGARKIEDIKNIDPTKIIQIFGKKIGIGIINLGNGEYVKELGEEREQEGISRIGTLKELTRDTMKIEEKIEELEGEAKEWLMKNKKAYRTISIIFITRDLKIHTKSKSSRNPKRYSENIQKEKHGLISEFIKENPSDIRRVGIRFGNLSDLSGQTTLF